MKQALHSVSFQDYEAMQIHPIQYYGFSDTSPIALCDSGPSLPVSTAARPTTHHKDREASRRAFSALCAKLEADNHVENAKAMTVRKTETGQPVMYNVKLHAADTRFALSLTHSGTLGAAGVVSTNTFKSIGIDIEVVRTLPSIVANAFLTDTEKHAIETSVSIPQDAHIMLFWCIKEAYLKAIGTGLRVHPRRITVQFQGDPHQSEPLIFHDGRNTHARTTWTYLSNNAMLTRVILPKED